MIEGKFLRLLGKGLLTKDNLVTDAATYKKENDSDIDLGSDEDNDEEEDDFDDEEDQSVSCEIQIEQRIAKVKLSDNAKPVNCSVEDEGDWYWNNSTGLLSYIIINKNIVISSF